MKPIKSMFIAIVFFVVMGNLNAQEVAGKGIPFSIKLGSITITGTYSEGYMEKVKVNGTSIFWGLISWGGSETINCKPALTVCRIETILSVGFRNFRITDKGDKGFEIVESPPGTYPVVINSDGKNITFAVDLDQVSADKKSLYQTNEWKLENPFVLAPNVVSQLKLYEGRELKGFLIPAGNYPLKRDGNIVYWTWERPQ